MAITNNFDTIFEDCNSLQNTSGMFMNTNINGPVSNLLFDSCRGTLQDARYMFFETNIDRIKVGKAKINYYKNFTSQYESYLTDTFTTNVKRINTEENAKNTTFYNKYVIGSDVPGAESGYYKFLQHINSRNISPTSSIDYLGVSIQGKTSAYNSYKRTIFETYTKLQTNGDPINSDFYNKFYDMGIDAFIGLDYSDSDYGDILESINFNFSIDDYYAKEYLKSIYELNTGYKNKVYL
jgi:hypothetical protein